MENNYPRKLTIAIGSLRPAISLLSAKGIKGVLASLVLMLFVAGSAMAQTAYVTVPPASAGSSGLNRAPSGSVDFQRVASIYSAAELTNVNTIFPITTLGFNILTPAAAAATGNIKIYLVNTTDASFLRSNTWSTLISSPTAMQLVYDGPLTIPATAGWYDITLTTPFNYTGGGIYMAFEWTRTSAATTAPTYTANSTLVGGSNGWIGATSATSLPATLTSTSAFRPWIRLGYIPPANDAAVNAVYALGKLPLLSATTPHVISAFITNMGSQDIVNGTFTLNITGANTFTTTVNVPLLASFQSTTISFPAFTPTNVGVNTVTVTAPADAVMTNNTASAPLIVTPNVISYAQGSPPVSSGSGGFNTGSGGVFSKYTVDANSPVTVPVVRIGIGNNAASVGNRVFAVILNSSGVQIGRSVGYIIQAADLGNLVSFTIPNPPTVTGDFYVGLAQTEGTAGYFPLGIQAEAPTRAGAFFAVQADTTFTGSTAFAPVTTLGRFIIEADLIPVVSNANDLGVVSITGLSSGCGLSNAAPVCITVQNFGTASQSNFPVSYTLNGGTAVTATVPGPLAPGDSVSYCFTQTADLSTPGTYTIAATTGLTGDANTANDVTNLSVVSSASLNVNFGSVPTTVCVAASPITLSATPAGGTFSGTGVTGNTFNPATAGIGVQTITYNVTQGACSGTGTVSINVVALPAAPTATGASRCGPGSVVLSATAPTGTVAWYAAATGGNALGLGNTFATPSISTTTTYYAAATTLAMAGTVGPLNGAAVGAGAIGGPFTNEMLFNALVPLRIDSVTLISSGAGTYTIGIRNMLSTLPGSMKMDSVTVSVPAAGTHRVYLGLVVPTPGTGYTLGLFSATTGSGGLFRNTDGAVYPYTLPGVIAITGAAFGADPFTSVRYYNFYNWSVSTAGACESTRVPVIATVNAAPSAAFTFTNTGSTFNFAATSTTGTYAWTFAGGTPATATTANPTVTFATSGNKVVTLTVTENGCSTTFTQTVVISGRDADLNNALSLYPNPTTGLVQLDVKGQTGIEQVEVYNALGQLVKQQTFANQQQATLNLSGFAEGAYTVRVVNQHGIYVKQLLLQK